MLTVHKLFIIPPSLVFSAGLSVGWEAESWVHHLLRVKTDLKI